MSDREDQNIDISQDELSALESMSLEELLESTKEDLARVDALMGPGAGGDLVQEDRLGDFQAGVTTGSLPVFEAPMPQTYTDAGVEQEEYEEEEAVRERFRLPAGVKTLLYVCCVLTAAILVAVGGWLCADDIFALTKPDRPVNVTIAEGSTIDDVTTALQDQGLVKYGWLFKTYCWYSHAEEEIEAGTYTLNNLYDYHALVNGMHATAQERATVQITIPEGYECADIFSELAAQGVCALTDLEQVAANHEFEFDFLQDIPYGDKNRLEGYLFPDTYQFFVGDDAENVIDKFLRNFDRKLTEELRLAVADVNEMLAQEMTDNGFSAAEVAEAELDLRDILIVASLIEKETAKTSESASIASVIYNRLCSKLYPCLQIDATIQYVLPERKEILSNADKAFISPYNTYINAGLPPAPIANPGMNSIRAALYPAQTEYYFYALNKDGVHTFSETYYEHQEVLEEMENS